MTINLITMKRYADYHGDQRVMLPVFDSGSATGNQVLTMDHPMRELFITNDSENDNNMTVVVSGEFGLSLSFTLKPGESLNERFSEFSVVTVTATDGFRWYVRSGRIT